MLQPSPVSHLAFGCTGTRMYKGYISSVTVTLYITGFTGNPVAFSPELFFSDILVLHSHTNLWGAKKCSSVNIETSCNLNYEKKNNEKCVFDKHEAHSFLNKSRAAGLLRWGGSLSMFKSAAHTLHKGLYVCMDRALLYSEYRVYACAWHRGLMNG